MYIDQDALWSTAVQVTYCGAMSVLHCINDEDISHKCNSVIN